MKIWVVFVVVVAVPTTAITGQNLKSTLLSSQKTIPRNLFL
jgi:hypothetical protein